MLEEALGVVKEIAAHCERIIASGVEPEDGGEDSQGDNVKFVGDDENCYAERENEVGGVARWYLAYTYGEHEGDSDIFQIVNTGKRWGNVYDGFPGCNWGNQCARFIDIAVEPGEARVSRLYRWEGLELVRDNAIGRDVALRYIAQMRCLIDPVMKLTGLLEKI